MQLQNHSLTFIHGNKSFLSATSILSRSPMGYNTTVLVPTIWTLANVKTVLDDFLVQKRFQLHGCKTQIIQEG